MKIRRLRIACSVPNATNALSQNVVILFFHCNNVCMETSQCYVICTLLHLVCGWQCCNALLYSGVYYNTRCYNEWILQRTLFINNIRKLLGTGMLQRTRRNVIGRCSMRVPLTCEAFPLWLESHSSSLFSFVRFSYQFSSSYLLFVPLAGKDYYVYHVH